MRSRSEWITLAGLAVLAMMLILAQHSAPPDSPSHSSLSDSRNGTSALRLYAAQRGRSTVILDREFALPSGPGLLFIFNPENHFGPDEVTGLRAWLAAGGTAVYGDDSLDPRLGIAFGLRRTRLPLPSDGWVATPALGAVRHITADSIGRQFVVSEDQAVLLRAAAGSAAVLEERIGEGRLIAIASPQVLANGWLERADNTLLAADLLSITPGPVLFDEFHHGLPAGARGERRDWMAGPLGMGLFWGATTIFMALVVRGRAFGPRLPATPGGSRSVAEYAHAVGRLLRRAGGRAVAAGAIIAATRRVIARRAGLTADLAGERFDSLLAQRAPAIGRDYSESAMAAAGATSDAALLRAARRLHRLAYPAHPSTRKEQR